MNNINKTIIVLLAILFVFSCTNSRKDSLNEISLSAKDNIRVLLDSFVKENMHEKYIYELYIDKITPDSCNMILYTGDESLTKKENEYYGQKPVAFVIAKGVKIFIYSGIERYFENYSKSNTLPFQSANNDNSVLWALIDYKGVINYYKIDGGYPFFPFPLKNEHDDFAPPIVIPK